MLTIIYGITGGVPHYINKLGVHDSVDDALLENLFDRSSYLYEEPANLLKQELREPAIYNAIIKAIAEGASRMNDITTKVGEETSVVGCSVNSRVLRRVKIALIASMCLFLRIAVLVFFLVDGNVPCVQQAVQKPCKLLLFPLRHRSE